MLSCSRAARRRLLPCVTQVRVVGGLGDQPRSYRIVEDVPRNAVEVIHMSDSTVVEAGHPDRPSAHVDPIRCGGGDAFHPPHNGGERLGGTEMDEGVQVIRHQDPAKKPRFQPQAFLDERIDRGNRGRMVSEAEFTARGHGRDQVGMVWK